jgi:hypothetical protein
MGTGRELPAALNPKHTGASFIFSSESFVPKVEDDGENYVMVSFFDQKIESAHQFECAEE